MQEFDQEFADVYHNSRFAHRHVDALSSDVEGYKGGVTITPHDC